jgi:gliding motility-associated-like protein
VSGSVTVTVQVECAEPYVFVPNAFTPNGDGQNDVFMVMGNKLDEFTMVIYNRWGEKVFESQDANMGWDGTFEGKELPSDVFAYMVRLRCFNGEIFEKQGNVSLLR